MTVTTVDSDDVWVGVDLGTQSVRALAVRADGDVLGHGTEKLASQRDGRRHEQDPESWWRAVCTTAKQALREVPARSVRGVAVDATSGTVLLTDHAGRAVTPALMYDDGRAVGELDIVNEVGGALWNRLGYRRMQAVWALPKTLWLLRTYPKIPSGARLAHQSDVVNQRLTGHAVPTDLSNALKTGADLIDEKWPEQVMVDLGIPAELLPPLVRSGTAIGTVCPSAAEATGIPAGTPVIAGTTDGCAGQIGAGALEVGSWNSVLGTTLVLKGVTRELLRDPLGVVYCHRAPTGDWLPGGASSTGAVVISRDFAGRSLAALEAGARRYEPTGVIAYPLGAKGERFPFVAPDAEPFLLGRPAEDAERYAAVLQGVAYVERLAFDYLELLGAPVDGRLVLTGGATKSAYWCQLRADILGRPVSLPASAEPALGMAVLAASVGHAPAEIAARMVRLRQTIEPRPASAGRYDDTYLRFINELEGRGWLEPKSAQHTRKRTCS